MHTVIDFHNGIKICAHDDKMKDMFVKEVLHRGGRELTSSEMSAIQKYLVDFSFCYVGVQYTREYDVNTKKYKYYKDYHHTREYDVNTKKYKYYKDYRHASSITEEEFYEVLYSWFLNISASNVDSSRKTEGLMKESLDTPKLMFNCLTPEFEKAMVKVMTIGAAKYARNNWKQATIEQQEHYVDALMRHLNAWRSGEIIDTDSGCPHLAHLACNAMFLHFFDTESATLKASVAAIAKEIEDE
ncbi:MAG: DUF5664 domain-containing protein [Candidatus Dojkabacteria bacterium]|jgi:hypothetical protein|nr:DUF5664 domain-containing protein [Candidatus Dojkabacteria bacterium]MDX9738916.1 DUF5664 domain-containing protein [Candidatus Dojkabacteria bacterium]